MGYIESNLLQNEEVIYRTKCHWVIYLNSLFLFVMAMVLFLWAGVEKNQNIQFVLMITALILIIWSIANGIPTLIEFFTSEFGVTNQRVLIKVGLIKRETFELLLNKVESFQVNQTIMGRILGYGSILISGTGGGKDVFYNIDDPLELKRQVQQSTKEYEHPPQVQTSVSENKKEVISIADELKKLSDLKEQGILTEDEFEEQKRKLLDQ